MLVIDADILRNLLFTPSISSSDLIGLQNRINQEKAVKNHQPDKYAALVRGSSEERFVADTSLAYQTLLENGFKPENIYILAVTKKRKEIYFHPIDDIATRDNLEILMNYLYNIVDEEDLLFIYLVDHGGRVEISNPNHSTEKILVSVFGLGSEMIDEFELASYLFKMHPKKGILLFSSCSSGGFAERLGGAQYTAIASTTSDNPDPAIHLMDIFLKH